MGDKKTGKKADEKLKRRVHALEARAQIDAALYRIALAASSATDMQTFYAAMHDIVGELMDARNFYIALYDDERQMINFPYYADEVDLDVPDPNVWEPFGVGNARGTTAYVLRKGKPTLLTSEVFDDLTATGEIELVGDPGQDWLGVPLRLEGRTLGVLAVQTYAPQERLTQSDLEILTVVGEHVATRAGAHPSDQRDAPAQCRADARQRRPARSRGAARDAGDVRPGRGPHPGDLRRASGGHRDPRSRVGTTSFPLHDRTGGPVPG